MLHAAIQNIKGLRHFGVRWRVFFNTFAPVGNHQLLMLGLTLKQLGKFPILLVRQLLECPRQWAPILHTLPLHTFRRFNDNYRRSCPCPLNGLPSKRDHEK
ncbi:hypothetical protein AVEN_192770-1 [Araneus ventricosus]|uniref:Uncharacterized protein n=1 Tax=Araneus ventricosus TaxID=182803 RepID=A0A4Y2NRX8_ARAVE|nr:hypothetical protein AVEN_192770-1 [Araneus ventricosus]